MQPFVELPDVPTRNVFGKCEKIVELTFDILIESSIVKSDFRKSMKTSFKPLKKFCDRVVGVTSH